MDPMGKVNIFGLRGSLPETNPNKALFSGKSVKIAIDLFSRRIGLPFTESDYKLWAPMILINGVMGVLKIAENKWVTEVIILIGVIIPLIRGQKGHIESPWNLFFQQTWITK